MSRDLFRLYQLIWKRFAASRMAPARYETLQIRIQAADSYLFTAGSGRLDFDGYRKVYAEAEEEEKAAGYPVGSLEEGERLTLKKTDPEQHFTQPPAHYTEASLVKTLEELGIGRPSTYAPTITTLLARHYITKEKKNLYITELGDAVNNIMKSSFPEIDNVQFTAYMESMLDSVAEGKTQWKQIVRNFYPDLEREVMEAEQKLDKVSIEDEKTDIICEHCGRNMVIKYGPHGKFLACPGFPECRNTKPYFEKAGVKCPKCGQEIVLRRSKKGRRFYGCENPECDFVSWQKPSDIPCPQCGSYMVERGAKLVCANSSCGFSMAKETQQASSAS
jgi:DNA topoisomerase-1